MALSEDLTNYQQYKVGTFQNTSESVITNALLLSLTINSSGITSSLDPPQAPTFDTVDDSTLAEVAIADATRNTAIITNRSATNRLKVNLVEPVTQALWLYDMAPGQTLHLTYAVQGNLMRGVITILAAAGSCEYSYWVDGGQ